MEPSSGSERPGLVGKCLYGLIAILLIVTVVFAIEAMRREPDPVRGSTALPGQVADGLGQRPNAAPTAR
jgi:hypothetical protein